MWWKAETHSLTRVEDRISFLYTEHAILDRRENTIEIVDNDGLVSFPATTIASLMLGPGTRITHAAIRLLADSGTSTCWVGENGVRMYAHAISQAQSTRYLSHQAWLVSDHTRRLNVAKQMYEMRFPGEEVTGLTIQQLRGREGARIKNTYKLHASRTGINWQGRHYIPGQAFAAGDDLNRTLSALNTALYGICHAAIVGLGASPSLGFVHLKSAVSFVLDIADLYKAEITIPAAFDLVSEGLQGERHARIRFRDLVLENMLMTRIVSDIRWLLLGIRDAEEEDVPHAANLIDEHGEVAGGVNYAKFDNWNV